MIVRLQDTLTGETRPLEPIGDVVGIYSCGPTVYGPVHVGNFRSFLFADLLVRHLRWRGYRVRWVMNITDVDDKIIRGAAAAGIGIDELADRHLAGFLAEAATLRMTTPDVLPRATQHIDRMVELIATLLERGHAYRTDDGSIFFRIASWPTYGRLARLDPEQLRVGERVEADEYAKDDVRDFAVWKGPKPGEPSWDTAIGPGRPGWHIECSAMSMAHLGPSFDIHTGGVDLVFPHHEDEIAQSEAATGQEFVRTWLHCAHLQMSGSKMAKSTGNIARVGELLARGVSPRALRYALIRSTTAPDSTTTDESLAAAGPPSLGSTLPWRRSSVPGGPGRRSPPGLPGRWRAECFGEALDDDLNISAGLAAGLRPRPRAQPPDGGAVDVEPPMRRRRVATLRDLDRCSWECCRTPTPRPSRGPRSRCWPSRRPAAPLAAGPASDRLRDALADREIAVEDTRDGQRWRRTVEAGRG